MGDYRVVVRGDGGVCARVEHRIYRVIGCIDYPSVGGVSNVLGLEVDALTNPEVSLLAGAVAYSRDVRESSEQPALEHHSDVREALIVHDLADFYRCLLYTSDAADDSLRVDLGGRRII